MTDIANSLTESIAKTGVTTPTANLPMGGFKHLAVAIAAALDQYARADQVQTGVLTHLQSVSMTVANTYTAILVLAPPAFIKNQLVIINFPSSNTGPATLNINGTGARGILKASGTPLAAGSCKVGEPFILIYDGADWRMFIDSSGFSGSDVVAALGYTPIAQNGSIPMLAQLTLVSPPVAATDAASKAYVDGIPRVSSFNTRTGAVVLLQADVDTALGYIAANRAGQIFTGHCQSPGWAQTPLVLTTGGAVNLDYALGQSQVLTLNANTTIGAISGLGVGTILRLVFKLTTFTLAWGVSVKWANGIEPGWTTGANKTAVVVITWDGTNFLGTGSVF